MPGGWADVGYTPFEVAVKEVFEETGLHVDAVRLLAVFDKSKHDHPEEPWYVVLVPQVSVSTAEIFSDPLLTRNSPPIKVRPVPKGNSRNDCLPVVARRYPEVRNALDLLGKFTEAKLTGTGSCVFGGFPSKAEADKVSALLTETLTGFVAKGSNISMLHRKLQSML